MSTDISSIAFAIRAESARSPHPLKLSQAQQCLVAALGYKTLASYQSSTEESATLDEATHVILDVGMLVERSESLDLPHDEETLVLFVAGALKAKIPRIQVHTSLDKFEDTLREKVNDVVLNHEETSGAMAVTNNDGIDEIYLPLSVEWDDIPFDGETLDIEIDGHITMEIDIERPYSGHRIEVNATLILSRIGRSIVGTAYCRVNSAKLDYNWGGDDRYGEPVKVSLTELLSEFLGLSFDEADELVDAELLPVEGSDGIVNEYLFDFTTTASRSVAKKLQAKYGSLSVRVPVNFFESVHERDPRPERYYVHGDQIESKEHFWCLHCDSFEEASHFEKKHPGMAEEQYFASLRRWQKLPAIKKINRPRPSDAVNALAALAETQNRDREASRSGFHRWIETQLNRDDPVGDLARDIKRDHDFPIKESSREVLQLYFGRVGSTTVTRAFNRAWIEFATNSA
jgi:YozE SAM-like fold